DDRVDRSPAYLVRVGRPPDEDRPRLCDPKAVVERVERPAEPRGVAADNTGHLPPLRRPEIALGDKRGPGEPVLLSSLEDRLHLSQLVDALVLRSELRGRVDHHVYQLQ